MIALYSPQQLAESLAVPDGLDPADMHVTVAYLGSTADVDRDSLNAAAQALAARRPIEATLSGHARFTGGDQDVIVALIDSPHLEDLRRDTLDALDERDVAVPREHGYTPHLTITYIDQGDDAPVDRLDAQPVNFTAVSAVYGAERTDFRFLLAETAPSRVAAENATIQLGDLKGIWRPVYAHRQALHATADKLVLDAWRRDIEGISLRDAVTAAQRLAGETVTDAQRRRRDAAAAAVLAALSARSWRRTKTALATAAKRAHRTGWAAGHAIVTRDQDDDSPYDEPDSDYSVGSPDMSDHLAQGTATATLTAALAATARRAGRAIADGGDTEDGGEGDGENVLDDGYDISLATDVAISAAYGAGMLAAYIAAGLQSLNWITAGDERVCEACIANEAGGPYSLLGTPRLPAHPRCRCVLVGA
jgi:2'-5' RNA ligase